MESNQKLYIVVRSDLEPGLRLAQACHAMRAFTERHPALDREWYDRSNNVAILAVDDEPALRALCGAAEARAFAVAPFLEPDLGDALTAVALEPAAKRLVARLRLAS